MKTKRARYIWFVEPLKNIAHANEVIARFLGEEVDDAHSFHRNAHCSDNNDHRLWDCGSKEKAKELWDSKVSLQIKIKPWRQGYGKIRPYSFIEQRRKPIRKLARLTPSGCVRKLKNFLKQS